jgi:hypothetical protein
VVTPHENYYANGLLVVDCKRLLWIAVLLRETMPVNDTIPQFDFNNTCGTSMLQPMQRLTQAHRDNWHTLVVFLLRLGGKYL